MESSTPTVTLATFVRGAVLGVLAALLGYLAAFTGAGAVERATRGFSPLRTDAAHLAPAWKQAGWLFYDAHFVGTAAGGRHYDLVRLADVGYLYLVPIALLLLAGGTAAWFARSADPLAGAVAGATVAIGYVLFVAVGLLLVGHAGVGPDPLRGLVLSGVVYPVAFGAVGGALAGVVLAE